MQGEVDALRRTGRVVSCTSFPDGREFRYALESSPASVTPAASYAENQISVRVPESQVLAWANSNEVSIRAQQRLDDDNELSILVEKDFACLAPRDEDESDMFPHPDAAQGEC